MTANNGEQWRVLENIGAGRGGGRKSPKIADLLQQRAVGSAGAVGESDRAGWPSDRRNAVVEHKAQRHNGYSRRVT